MKILEVRCCCVPGRVLGTIQVSDTLAYPGSVIHFWAMPKMRRIGEVVHAQQAMPVHLDLDVREFTRGFGQPFELAVQAHEDKLPLLRLLLAFKEKGE